MISAKDLQKKFGRLFALDGVTADFNTGNSYALIGPNGSGKTTLIKSILGLVIPTLGTIEVDGDNIKGKWQYRSKIGYMPQIGRYPDNMRIGQLFDMMHSVRQDVASTDDDLIEAFGLAKMKDKRMHALSGGTRQKVSAALAFLFQPPVLILDEPTAGLDPISVEVLKEKVLEERSNGKLIIITSHIMSDLDDMATWVIYLNEGRIAWNSSIDEIKQVTGEERLGRAVSAVMRGLMQGVDA